MPDLRLYKHYNRLLYDTKKTIPNRTMNSVSRRFSRLGPTIYRRLFELEVGKRIPGNFNRKHIAESVFFTSMTELDKMLRRRDFYSSNSELFLHYVSGVCNSSLQIGNFAEGRLQQYIFESVDLLKLHSQYISKNGFDYSQWRTEYTEYYRLYRNSLRLINFEPVADSNLGIATLRMCIENRIRSAIGIIGIYSPNKHEVIKISMSRLFEVLKARRADIEMECDLDIVHRVYSWSNHFIHASYANYSWLVPFAHDLLQPLFHYAPIRGDMNLYASIRMKPEVLKEMRDVIIQPYREKDANVQVHGYQEEHCFIGRL